MKGLNESHSVSPAVSELVLVRGNACALVQQHDCATALQHVSRSASELIDLWRRSRALHVVSGACSSTRVTSSVCVIERMSYVDGKKLSSPYSMRIAASKFSGIMPRTLSKIFRNLPAVM